MRTTTKYDAGKTSELRISDLGCSAALLCAGFELISLDKSNPRRVDFIFKRKRGLDEAIDDYFNDRLEVKARRYFDNLKALKNAIYNA